MESGSGIAVAGISVAFGGLRASERMKKESDNLESRKERLVAEIRLAFASTKLGSGLSFAQAELLDAYEPIEAVRASRKEEPPHWSTLVDDPRWYPFPGLGGFVFMDVHGFRYYVPPTMIRMLRNVKERDPRFAEFITQFLSHRTDELLSSEQRLCVAKFLEIMSDIESDELRQWAVENPWGGIPPDHESDLWQTTLDSFWNRYLSPS